jgi:hypothetical protein
MTTDIVGKTVASVEVQDWAGQDAFKDTVTWERTVITFTDGSATSFDSWDGEAYDEYLCEFDDNGQPRPLVKTTRTCRHCGRAIGQDPDGRWIDPEAGWDDENGDGVWRETCDENHEDRIAAHEPKPTHPSYYSASPHEGTRQDCLVCPPYLDARQED